MGTQVDFYINHTHADQAWGEWIAWELEAAGYSVTLAAMGLGPQERFGGLVDRALGRAERVLVVVSHAFLDLVGGHAGSAAAAPEAPARSDRLLAVRVEPVEVPAALGSAVSIDLAGEDEDTARRRLLGAVRGRRSRPIVAPGFPGRPSKATDLPRFPSALPPVWNVPYPRNPNFVGREALLLRLAQRLDEHGLAAVTQARVGLRGIGKTKLVAEYAYRYRSRYDVVWWARADDPVALVTDYAALAFPLALPQRADPDQHVILAAVKRWLAANDRWLLVFDGAGPPGQVILEQTQFRELRGFLPEPSSGHAIIVSAVPAWGAWEGALVVDALGDDEAVRFLSHATGDDDTAAARALARQLGHLPLALEQAASYARETGASLATYLARLRQSQAAQPAGESKAPAFMRAAARMTLDAVGLTSPGAAQVLEVAAFLAGEDIPRDLFLHATPQPSDALAAIAADPAQLDAAVALLQRFALVETSEDAFTIHPLTQAIVQDTLDGQVRGERVAVAASLVEQVFPARPEEPSTWSLCERIVPHALAAAGHAAALHVALPQAATLLDRVGAYLSRRGQLREAQDVLRRALSLREELSGPDDPAGAATLNSLGLVMQQLGDLAGAKAAFERALALAEAAHGPDHPDVASRLNNLGGALGNLGDLAGAKAAFERALAIDEAAYGRDHPSVSIRLNNLGRVLRDLGDLAGARAAFERALAIDEAAYGPSHPSVSIGLSNLGATLYAMGDLAQAERVLRRALDIDESVYGPNHAEVATDLGNLGRVMEELGDLHQARAAFERARDIHQRLAGAGSPDVAEDLGNLGRVLHELGEVQGARAAFERALAIYTASLGGDHPLAQRVSADLEGLPGPAPARDERPA